MKKIAIVGMLLLTFIQPGCKKEAAPTGFMGGQNPNPPKANAGADITLRLPRNDTTLAGTYAAANKITGIAWRKLSGPDNFGMLNEKTLQPKITGLVKGIYAFEMKVTDSLGGTASDTMKLVILADTSIPRVDAGDDVSIRIPKSEIILSGTHSTEHDIIDVSWRKRSGPDNFIISNEHTLQPKLSMLVKGVHEFELKVTNSVGLYAIDIVKVVVLAAPVPIVLSANSYLFEDLQWIFPWYNALEIPAFKAIDRTGTKFKVYIKRSGAGERVEVRMLSSGAYDSAVKYEYFVETRPDGAGMYNTGSLYIFYYGPDVGDHPEVWIEFE